MRMSIGWWIIIIWTLQLSIELTYSDSKTIINSWTGVFNNVMNMYGRMSYFYNNPIEEKNNIYRKKALKGLTWTELFTNPLQSSSSKDKQEQKEQEKIRRKEMDMLKDKKDMVTPQIRKQLFQTMSQQQQQRSNIGTGGNTCNNTLMPTMNHSPFWIWSPFPEYTNGSLNYHNTSISPQTYEDNNTLHIYSNDGRYKFIFDEITGEFVLYMSWMPQKYWYISPLNHSNNNNNNNNNSDLFYAKFTNEGDLQVFNYSNQKMIFSLANSDSTWNGRGTEGPYTLLVNNGGQVQIQDSNGFIVWASNSYTSGTMRSELYPHVTNDRSDPLYKTELELVVGVFTNGVYLWIDTHFYRNTSVNTSIYANQYYAIQVSIYSGSAKVGQDIKVSEIHPTIYYFPITPGRWYKLDASPEPHTFLCESANIRNFYLDILPLNISHNATWHMSIDTYPWNPCTNNGWPILATKPERECMISNDSQTAMQNLYYANEMINTTLNETVQLQAILNETCAGQYRNITIQNVTFPADFDYNNCMYYYYYVSDSNTPIYNSEWNSTECQLLRNNCANFYDVCYNYTHRTCTCYCPRDRKGSTCEYPQKYSCNINVTSAPMDICESLTQEDLNLHGRSDYDVRYDGDKPCFFVPENGHIVSTLKTSCQFTEQAQSQVWEDLPGYTLYPGNLTFEYCIGTENSSFALTSPPPNALYRVKIFNFARIYNNDYQSYAPLALSDWAGLNTFVHNSSIQDLPSDYKIGGRIYVEYQFWVDGERASVTRRFYDIDHWKMPTKSPSVVVNIVIVIIVCLSVIAFIYLIWKCNKWCQKLDHEKMD